MKKIKKGLLNVFALSTLLSNSLSAIKIDLDLGDNLTLNEQYAFRQARNKWQSILINDDLPEVEGNNDYDIVIKADAISIDGPGRILGQAGPTRVRRGSYIPSQAIMEFDAADLAEMERDGTLKNVIVHEMSHALGFGTIWSYLNLTNNNIENPLFLGTNAKKIYKALRNGSRLSNVPLENMGGPGTAGSHWRKSIFENELMTGSISSFSYTPVSVLTIAAFEDMGYQVDYKQADSYFLPIPAEQQYQSRPVPIRTPYDNPYLTPVCQHKTICPRNVYYSQMCLNSNEIEPYYRRFY